MHSVWCQFLSGLSEMSVGDWINTLMLLVAMITLIFTSRSLRLQARATDGSSYLELMARFSDAWRRFRDADEHKDYEFRELLNLIEASCHLCRYGVLGRASKEMMEESLKENIKGIVENSYSRPHLKQAVSGPKTFSEMRRFSKKHNIPWPERDTD